MHVIPQSWSHVHILISVFPSFGLLIVLGFYFAGVGTANDGVKRVSLFMFCMLALLAVPIYFSGTQAMAALTGNIRFPKDSMSAHATWGMVALGVLVLNGVVAAFDLLRSRGTGRTPNNMAYLVSGVAIVTLCLTGFADELGWQLNHNELRALITIPEVSTSPVWSHVHVVLNHVPTAGFVFAIAFFLIALVADNDVLKRSSLVLFVICSVIGVPTYVSGTATMWALTQPPIAEISKAVINAHRDMALWTLFGLAFTGAAAWLELWRYRYLGSFSRLSLMFVLLFAVITLGIMTETGHRGGLINHPEIRVATELLPTDPDGVTTAIEHLANSKIWYVPWQIVHFFGFCLIFGTVFAVTLRVLGFWKNVSFAAVHRILLLGFVGVLMNVFSGMFMMLADSYRWVVDDYTFAPKVALIAVGATAVLYFSTSERLWKLKPGEDAPAGAKWATVGIFCAWAGVIICGRLLAYL